MEVKKYTGFTLIELLAVIVILAVIALIATPIIMNVIQDSKKGAAKDAMYGYVKAVELAGAKQISPTTDAPDGDYTTENGNLKQGSEVLEITFKGTKPANEGTVKLSKGNVTSATLIFDGICIQYDGKKAEEDKTCNTPTNSAKTYTIGEEVYFDPTGTITDCSSGKEWTVSNTSTTCYKWNVIKDNGNNIEMLLDHNTTPNVVWNSSGYHETGPKEIYEQLKIDTDNWNKAETLTSSDNVIRNNNNGGTYTINYSGMKARLISGQEIANIGGDTAWSSSNYTEMEYTTQPWLYQNTTDNGDNSTDAYWTDTAFNYYTNKEHAWIQTYTKYLSPHNVNNGSRAGLRPVARVSKSNL